MASSDFSAAVHRGMQALLARRAGDLAAGAMGVGWKIGFNTPAIQEHFGLTEPVVGYLTDAGVTPDGAVVPLAGWTTPAVEAEIAIRIGDDLGVAGLAPALELVDLGMPFDDIEVVLAGNIGQRGVVFGKEVPGGDAWAVEAVVTKHATDGHTAVVAEGRISESPETTTTFVRSYLSAHGAALAPGDRIIAGSMVPPVTVTAGEELHVTFGPFGELHVGFS